ncbi:MAG: trigger factor [Candidatus Paceibacterota bacterium]|jgi:trigger factor
MTEQIKNYGSASVKKLEKSQVEITGSISSDIWEKYRAKALKNINESVSMDGFRKGMIPENVLLAKIGEMSILEEMAELALSPAFIDIIVDNNLDVIGKPQIQITKLAKGNPLEFMIKIATVPEINLPDYKSLAQKEIGQQNPEDVKLTFEEIENTITRIRSDASSQKVPVDSPGGQNPQKNTAPVYVGQVDKDGLPELTDAFVKTLGAFESVSDFREKLSIMLTEKKADEEHQKLRVKIADSLVENTNIDLPEILVESELSRIEAQFKTDIEKMNVKMEDYLKHAKKTIEDIRGEWRPHAEKKAKIQLILNSIARKEKIVASDKDIEHEVEHILEHYKDADRDSVRVYVETMLSNEMVFQFLEKKE